MKMNHDNTTSHFFASSAATWITTTPKRTLKDLLAHMEREGYPFGLFYVPVPWDSDYSIKMYQPQVEGTVCLGLFEPMKKGETMKETTDLTTMWEAFASHQPIADKHGYGTEWAHMCSEKTVDAVIVANKAAEKILGHGVIF